MNIEKALTSILSIRLLPDGFSFYKQSEDLSDCRVKHFTYTDKTKDFTTFFKECIYQENITETDYRQIKAIVCNTQSTLLPDILIKANKHNACSYFLSPTKHLDQVKILIDPLITIQQSLVYSLDESLYHFMMRQFPEIHFKHRISLLLHYFLQNAQFTCKEKAIFVLCEKNSITFFVKDVHHKIITNTLAYTHCNNAAYYILHLYYILDLDQIKHPLHLHGKEEYVGPIAKLLEDYIKQIGYTTETADRPLEIQL